MKVLRRRARYVIVVLGVITGCHAGGPSLKQMSPAAKPPPPVQYAPARDGLPKTRIWKSQIAFGDIDGDGFADIGAVSRLADGPYIWKSDGKGHWTDASSGLPRESFCGGGMAFG